MSYRQREETHRPSQNMEFLAAYFSASSNGANFRRLRRKEETSLRCFLSPLEKRSVRNYVPGDYDIVKFSFSFH